MVPKDYDHDTQLSSFVANNRDNFQFIHKTIENEQEKLDMRYTKFSQRLATGGIYAVRLLNVNPKLPFSDYLDFLNEQKALFVGAPGLSLVWQIHREEFPERTWVFSLDMEQKDWDDTDYYYAVPTIILGDKGWYFNQLWVHKIKFNDGNTSGYPYALLYLCKK